ncbi:MAG TPA: nucleotide exchange factor GrpE [Acidimicrobiales bacterium]
MSGEGHAVGTDDDFVAQPHVEAHVVDAPTGDEAAAPRDEAAAPPDAVVPDELPADEAPQGEAPPPPEGDPDEGGTDEGGTVEGDLAELTVRVQGERDEYLDALRRLQADFANYKKRVLKHQSEQAERAAELLVVKLLPVLDTVDLAVAHTVEGDGPGEAGALQQVAASLTDTLAKEGLERIDPVGQAFDPMEADAVVHEPGQPGEGGGDDGPIVTGVLRAGYRWKGRVVRPAMVKVTG